MQRKDTTPQLAACRGASPERAVREVLDRLDVPGIRGRTVLVKPDAALALAPDSGLVTRPEVTGAVIEWLRGQGAADVAVGDCPALGVPGERAFEANGLARLARDKDVRLLDFDAGPCTTLTSGRGGVAGKFLATGYLDAYDLLVCLPVLRPQAASPVLGNMKGLAVRVQKLAFYAFYGAGTLEGQAARELALEEVGRLIRPALCVCDATAWLRNSAGDGLVMAGTDCAALDMAAALLLGSDPARNGFLERLARAYGKPEASALRRELKPWLKAFAPQDAPLPAGPEVWIRNSAACDSCRNAIYTYLEKHWDELPQGRVDFFIGRESEPGPRNTFYVGTCGSRPNQEACGHLVAGCPPRVSQIRCAVRQHASGPPGRES